MNIAVVVPVYNEEERAVKTVKRILNDTESPIVVVDDGSTDHSYKMLVTEFKKVARVVILRHVINLGKGAAMKTGVEYAFNIGKAEAVIFVDADGQHNPERLKDFERALDSNKLVFGYREFNEEMPFLRKQGNIIALNIVRVLFNIRRKDLLCGFLGFRKEVYKQIYWQSSRYGVETEMAAKVGRNKLAFFEINVDTIYIDKYKGVTMLDAMKILINLPFWYIRK